MGPQSSLVSQSWLLDEITKPKNDPVSNEKKKAPEEGLGRLSSNFHRHRQRHLHTPHENTHNARNSAVALRCTGTITKQWEL